MRDEREGSTQNRSAPSALFHLNATEAARIATLIPRQPLLVKQPHVSKVLNLQVDPHGTALFSAMRRA